MVGPARARVASARALWRSALAYPSVRAPTVRNTFLPFLIVASLVFMRSLRTNYIFDEQEALLANPYVNGDSLGFFEVFTRDFWGLPHTRSIGSYRPLPNMLWRILWRIHDHPWPAHACNVVVHALNASLLARFVGSWTKRHSLGWASGSVFLLAAIITEAVLGVVGLADVLSGLGILLALSSLALPLPQLVPAVFGAILFGMFSKESTLTATVLIGLLAFTSAPVLHAEHPRRFLRAMLATIASVLAVVAYTACRRKYFPAHSALELERPLAVDASWVERALRAFLSWFQQPRLPNDPINNPLVNADVSHRVAGALRVYAEGLEQVLVPYPLSGDYSFPQEPIPETLIFPGSVLGALGLLVPLLMGAWCCGYALLLEYRSRRSGAGGVGSPRGSKNFAIWALIGSCLIWVPLAYIPHGNFFTLLPTVRAERFWYQAVIGTSVLIAWVALTLSGRHWGRFHPRARWVLGAYLLFQASCARWHAFDYADDLAFWGATASASERSAKAHLNYGVMLGAHLGRDDWRDALYFWRDAKLSPEEEARRRDAALAARLVENTRALELAPDWPMASIYQGDVYCRLRRIEEAWKHYRRGFTLGPNEQGLIALALQCLWDADDRGAKGAWIEHYADELQDLAAAHEGDWIAYFGRGIVNHGKEHDGIEAKYRPRSYDDGPTQDE